MTRYILISIVLFIGLKGIGQTDFEDWKSRGEMALAEEDYSKAVMALEHAKQSLPKEQTSKPKGDIYNDLGVAYYQIGDYKKSIRLCTKALEFYKLARIDTLVAGSMYNLGIAYKDLGLSNRAMDYLLQSARIFEKRHCLLKLSAAWNSMGNVCRDTKKFNKAIDYHERALNVRKQINYDKGIADSYQNLGNVYLEWGRYNQARFFLKKALHKKLILQQANIVTTYSSLGRLYLAKGESQVARTYLTKAYELRINTGNSVKVAESLLYLANYYVSTGEIEKGLVLFREIEQIARKEEQPQLLSEALKREISLISQKNNGNVLINKYKELLKSLEQVAVQKNKKEVDRLEIAYDVERKNKELVLRRKQAKIDQLHFKQLLTASLGVFLMAIIAWIAYYYIRHSKRKIEYQKEEIKYLHYELSHRTKNYFSLLSGMLVLDIKKARHADTVQILHQVKRRLEAMSLVQHYLLDDSSRNNKEVELGAYFKKLIDILLLDLFTFKDQPHLVWDLEEIYFDYDRAMRLAIVLNELVCNAVEHGLPYSDDPELYISIHKSDDELQVVVKDNGRGISFKKTERQEKKGVGLLEKLLKYLNGTLTYGNENGCVATVRIEI